MSAVPASGVVLAALLTACGASRPAGVAGTDAPRARRGGDQHERSAERTGAGGEVGALPVLRVGTSGDYAPFSSRGAGFDVEVATRMAADLGYRIEWIPFTWPALQESLAHNAFDVGMSGVTWRPERAVVGFMSRAVAIGGPCVLSRKPPGTVAVNRGGILERWARQRFAPAQIRTVDDNQSLPGLLERGEVDAIITDSFELAHFARDGLRSECEPPRDRKVYWVSPQRAAELGPRIDAWLRAHESQLAELRARHLGRADRWTELDHLVDLLARRLALMPAVATYKRAHGLPIEDPDREAIVLHQAVDAAAAAGLDPASVRTAFAEQIALAKAVQQRAGAVEPMDLEGVLRPALSELGARILTSLAACADQLPSLRAEQLDLLSPLLEPEERARLLVALRAVRRASVSADPSTT